MEYIGIVKLESSSDSLWSNRMRYTVVSKIDGPIEFLPLDLMLIKSCNIERCGYKIHKIVTNMTTFMYN